MSDFLWFIIKMKPPFLEVDIIIAVREAVFVMTRCLMTPGVWLALLAAAAFELVPSVRASCPWPLLRAVAGPFPLGKLLPPCTHFTGLALPQRSPT